MYDVKANSRTKIFRYVFGLRDHGVESDPGWLTQCDSAGLSRDASNPHNA